MKIRPTTYAPEPLHRKGREVEAQKKAPEVEVRVQVSQAARRAGRRSAALFASASGKGRRALCLLVLRRARLRRLLPGLRRLFCRRSLLVRIGELLPVLRVLLRRPPQSA